MPVSISGTNGVTFPDSSLQVAAASPYVLKNRIINGAMQVWQRGTSVTTSGAYTADRWTEVSGNSNQHIQSTDTPTNFGYSMQIIGVGANINQRIESLNCQDLSGQTITISFWVKNTSGTDTLGLSLYYPNTADTFSSFTQIGSTITISSNPSSSWTQYTTTFTSLPSGSKNGLSLYLFRLGAGAVSTTWYLTGMQLEIGSTATPFERRLYNQELANCQRYYYKLSETNYAGVGMCSSTTTARLNVPFPLSMRSAPAALEQSGTAADYNVNSGGSAPACSSVPTFLAGTTNNGAATFTVASGLTTGNGAFGRGTGYLAWSAEL